MGTWPLGLSTASRCCLGLWLLPVSPWTPCVCSRLLEILNVHQVTPPIDQGHIKYNALKISEKAR
jgi:hypothetical protein